MLNLFSRPVKILDQRPSSNKRKTRRYVLNDVPKALLKTSIKTGHKAFWISMKLNPDDFISGVKYFSQTSFDKVSDEY